MTRDFKTTKKSRRKADNSLAELKRELLKAATQLCYSKKIKEQIKNAETEAEAYRAMTNGRNSL